MLVSLSNMTQNQTGTIKSINGGHKLKDKLNALGLHESIPITKISNSMLGGPVTIRVGTMEIAIGRRMAEKIIVEV